MECNPTIYREKINNKVIQIKSKVGDHSPG